MSNQGNDSSQQFRYRKSIENMIGKRTGNFIRKSNIGIDFDGLENVNDYFETNTDKLSVANTDDFDTSVASDVFIDASDTEGRSQGGSSVKKGEKGKERRKKRWTEASSQNSFGFFDEMLQSIANQQDEKTDKKETLATITDLSSAKPPNPKRKVNNALPIAFRTQEDVQDSKEASPARDTTDQYEHNEMTNMTAMTHLTRTPSISRSSIDEGSASKSASALKNLSIIKQQKQNFSEYLQNDQRNKELEMKRKQLRQMQESGSQEISIFKSPISNDYLSPNKAFNLNLTTFSILDSTNKKAAFGAHHNASIEIATYNDNAQTYQSFVDHNNQDSRVDRKINLFEEDNRAQLKKPPSSKTADFQEPEKKKDKGKEKEKKDRIEAKENIKKDSNSNPNPKKVVKGTKNASKTVAIIEEEEVASKGKNNKTNEVRDNKFEAKNSKTTVAAPVAEEKKTSFEIKPLTKNKNANDDKKTTINKYTNKEPEEEKENMAPPAPKVVQKNKKNDKEKDKENNNGGKSTTRMIEEEKKQVQRKENDTKLRDITNSQDKERGMTSPGGFDRFQDSIEVGDHYFDMDQDVGPSIHNDYDYKSYEQHYGASHYENEKDKKSKDKQEEEKNKKVVQITKKERAVDEPKLKKVKKTKDVEDHAQEKTKKIKMPPKASKEKREKKEKDPLKEKKEPVRRNKRKRDAFLENYDRIIGPNDLHLIEQAVPVMRGSFANGRYPKRHRMPTFCFWKNERPIYKDMGNGREMVGLLVEENHPMPMNVFDYASSMEILTQEPKPSKKLAKMNKRTSFTDEKQMKKIRNTYVDSEEDEEENNYHHKLQALDKMELDYQIVSEDKDSIKVFLKLKPKQTKEAQINIAGLLRCTVIKCEDRKVEVKVDSKHFIFSLNDGFTIPAKATYSIQNKSKNKELELTCTQKIRNENPLAAKEKKLEIFISDFSPTPLIKKEALSADLKSTPF